MYSNLDLAIIAVVALYVLSGFFSGYLIGLVKLTSLFCIFLVLTHFTDDLLPYFTFIQDLNVSDNIAYSLTSLCAILIITFTSVIITGFLHKIPSNPIGRFLGGVLGLIRASIVIMVAIIFTAFIPSTWTKSLWETSQFLQFYGAITEIALSIVPEADIKSGKTAHRLSHLYYDEKTNQPSFEDINAPALTPPPGPENVTPSVNPLDLLNNLQADPDSIPENIELSDEQIENLLKQISDGAGDEVPELNEEYIKELTDEIRSNLNKTNL